MKTYKIYIRYSLSGVKVRYYTTNDKEKFYSYVGRLYLSSFEKIERIDYEVLT